MPKLVPLSEKLAKYKAAQEEKRKKSLKRKQKLARVRKARLPKPIPDIFADLPLDTKLPILPIEPRGLLGKAGDEPVMPPRCVQVVRSNVKWPTIQRDIWLGTKTAVQIAEENNVRKEDGSLDVVSIGKYRLWLQAQYAPIFEVCADMERKALRQTIVAWTTQTHEACIAGYQKAMTLKQRVKVGDDKNSRIEEVDNPNLEAANNFLQTALAAVGKFAELTALPAQAAPAAPSTLDARKQTFNVMVLPKTSDLKGIQGAVPVPPAAQLPVPSAQTIMDVLDGMPDDDTPTEST